MSLQEISGLSFFDFFFELFGSILALKNGFFGLETTWNVSPYSLKKWKIYRNSWMMLDAHFHRIWQLKKKGQFWSLCLLLWYSCVATVYLVVHLILIPIKDIQRPFKKNKNRSMCCLPSQKTRPENVSENFRLQWRTAARVEVHVRLFQWHFSRPLEKKITQWFLGDSYHHREIKKKICASTVYSILIIPPAFFFESFEVGFTGLCEWVISHFPVQNGKKHRNK